MGSRIRGAHTPTPVLPQAKLLATRPSLRTLVIFYWARVRAQPARELLALVGIAAGVGMLFAVQITSKSLTGSFDELLHGIAGKASLEVAARSPDGFDQGLAGRAASLPYVSGAAPVLERRIAVVGPKGRSALTLYGVDQRLIAIGGPLVKQAKNKGHDSQALGLQIPAPIAATIGAQVGTPVTVEVGERTARLPVAGVYGERQVGSLAQSLAAVAPLGLVQEIAGMPRRVTRVLVAPRGGQEQKATEALRQIAGGRLDVRPSDSEAKFLGEVAQLGNAGLYLAAVTSLVVGILLAYSAMLLAVLDRRAVIGTLRMLGVSRTAVSASLFFDALVLGLAGSLLGLLIGDQLSSYVMHKVPLFLGSAFAIGTQRIVPTETVLVAVSAGTIGALAAAARPALSLLRVKGGQAAAAEIEEQPTAAERRAAGKRTFWLGLGILAASTALAWLWPPAIAVALVAMVASALLMVPRAVSSGIQGARHLARGAVARLSLAELAANRPRAAALAATSAMATLMIVGFGGSIGDQGRGFGQLAKELWAPGDLWVAPGRLAENLYLTQPLHGARAAARIRKLPEVRAVRRQRGTYVDLPEGRIMLWALPASARYVVAPSQVIHGNASLTQQRLRQGGWAAMSATLAQKRGVDVGDRFSLPTPSGTRRLRLAATITNYGWLSGSILIGGNDFARLWHTKAVSALQVDLAPGVGLRAGTRAVRQMLGSHAALKVQTTAERSAATSATANEALSRTKRMTDMVMLAAVLAVVAAMLAAILQRRRRLVALRALGMGAGQLYKAIAIETSLVVLVGCAVGLPLCVGVQVTGSNWIHVWGGYPVAYSLAWPLALRTVVLIVAGAMLATVIASRLSLRFDPEVAFSPE